MQKKTGISENVDLPYPELNLLSVRIPLSYLHSNNFISTNKHSNFAYSDIMRNTSVNKEKTKSIPSILEVNRTVAINTLYLVATGRKQQLYGSHR